MATGENTLFNLDDIEQVPESILGSENGAEVLVENPQGNPNGSNKPEEENYLIVDVGENEDISGERPSGKEEKDSPHTPLAATLQEEGLLPSDFNFDDLEKAATVEDKWKVIKSGIDKVFVDALSQEINKYKSQFENEDAKTVLEAIEKGVPIESVKENVNIKLKYKDVTDDIVGENEEIQKKILTDYYKKTTQFSKERIEKEVKNKIDTGVAPEDAVDALKELRSISEKDEKEYIKNAEKQKIEYERQVKENTDKYVKSLDDHIKNMKEILPGIKISEKEQKEVLSLLTTPVKEINGQPVNEIAVKRMSNPISFDAKLAYYIKLGLFDDKVKFDKIQAHADTKAAKNLEKLLSSSNSLSGKPVSNKEDVDTGSLVDSIKNLGF